MTLKDAVTWYIHTLERLGAKSPLTIANEQGHLNMWCEYYGHLDVTDLTLSHVLRVAEKRRAAGVSTRSVNLDVHALKNLYKWLRAERLVPPDFHAPTDSWTPLRYKPARRSLLSDTDLKKVIELARGSDNPRERVFADFLEFCAYSGARRSAALAVMWADIDFEHRQVRFIRNTKYEKAITVDFNPSLERLLTDMHQRRRTDTELLFPDPFVDGMPLQGIDWMRKYLCRRAKVMEFKLHDLRHWFISKAVMAGVDFLTVAQWVGHADNGVLISKVYGHLSYEHRKRMAERLTL